MYLLRSEQFRLLEKLGWVEDAAVGDGLERFLRGLLGASCCVDKGLEVTWDNVGTTNCV